jgi:hypothetical protein
MTQSIIQLLSNRRGHRAKIEDPSYAGGPRFSKDVGYTVLGRQVVNERQ